LKELEMLEALNSWKQIPTDKLKENIQQIQVNKILRTFVKLPSAFFLE
jgi:hypothetical protein